MKSSDPKRLTGSTPRPTPSSRFVTDSTRLPSRATAVVQPGGSLRDAELIAAADEHRLAMVFTGRDTSDTDGCQVRRAWCLVLCRVPGAGCCAECGPGGA